MIRGICLIICQHQEDVSAWCRLQLGENSPTSGRVAWMNYAACNMHISRVQVCPDCCRPRWVLLLIVNSAPECQEGSNGGDRL